VRSGGGKKGWSGGGIKRWSGGGIKRRAGLWKRGDGWRGGPLRRRRQPGPARATWRRLSALSVFLRKSICMEYLYGRRALNSRKRWFPARVGSSRGEKVRSGGGKKRWSGGGIKRRVGLWKRRDGWRGGPLHRHHHPARPSHRRRSPSLRLQPPPRQPTASREGKRKWKAPSTHRDNTGISQSRRAWFRLRVDMGGKSTVQNQLVAQWTDDPDLLLTLIHAAPHRTFRWEHSTRQAP
jgi:hypothetical protein